MDIGIRTSPLRLMSCQEPRTIVGSDGRPPQRLQRCLNIQLGVYFILNKIYNEGRGRTLAQGHRIYLASTFKKWWAKNAQAPSSV